MTQEAMICPNEIVNYQTAWSEEVPPKPVMNGIGWRVAQTASVGQTFPMAGPVYWMECPDDIVGNEFCYDNNLQKFQKVLWDAQQT